MPDRQRGKPALLDDRRGAFFTVLDQGSGGALWKEGKEVSLDPDERERLE